MSTVVTENLKRSSETASRSLRGVAAAWASVDNVSTVVTEGSLNCSSVTDIAVGQYQLNLTSSFTSADQMNGVASARTSGTVVVSSWLKDLPSVSAQRCATWVATTSAASDALNNSVTFHGDLA